MSHLASQQRKELATALAVAAGSAWDRTGSWAGADLSPVLDLATRTGTVIQVRDQARAAAATSPGFARYAASPSSPRPSWCTAPGWGRSWPRFTGGGLGASRGRAFEAALLRAVAGAAGLAALLALVTGLGAARWLTRPVVRLIAVTRAMAHGDRGAGPARSAAAAS